VTLPSTSPRAGVDGIATRPGPAGARERIRGSRGARRAGALPRACANGDRMARGARVSRPRRLSGLEAWGLGLGAWGVRLGAWGLRLGASRHLEGSFLERGQFLANRSLTSPPTRLAVFLTLACAAFGSAARAQPATQERPAGSFCGRVLNLACESGKSGATRVRAMAIPAGQTARTGRCGRDMD
jgi:hypothetical protein